MQTQTETQMQPQLSRFLANASRFSAVADSVTDWSAASPCQGWSAADVLDHVVDTQREFLSQRGLDVGARPDGDPAVVWRRHLEQVVALTQDEQRITAEYDGYFGRTTLAATLADFYGFDLVVHRWDIGRAAGQHVAFSDEEMDAVEAAIPSFGEALYSEGICARPVAVPDDAPRQDRILATLGRRS
jgi:uncharacterized protein (TIGR03086 family)